VSTTAEDVTTLTGAPSRRDTGTNEAAMVLFLPLLLILLVVVRTVHDRADLGNLRGETT
jgi:hypothetical protein